MYNKSGAMPGQQQQHTDEPKEHFRPLQWGACELPDHLKDMPYQPFSKSDRIGKVCDWTRPASQDKKYANKYESQFGCVSQFTQDEEESTFHLVDRTREQKPAWQRGRFGRQNQRVRMPALGKLNLRDGSRKEPSRQGVPPNYRNRVPIKTREASVTIQPNWVSIEEMDFPKLSKLSLPGVKDGENLVTCGALEYYDKSYDRVNAKNEKPLRRIDRVFHSVGTTDDPVIRELSKTQEGKVVFATDAVLATLMCCTRSNYSWDVVVEKIGDKLFLDKRDDNADFDLLTVNETSVSPPQDDGSLNSPRNLALEATFVNRNFSQQVLKTNEPKYEFQRPNPFASEGEKVASVGYRYRKWDLNDDITLVARCEHDAVTLGPNNEPKFLTIKALNEWDTGSTEWRRKLDTQRGAVLANELRNNACKLAKWTVQAVLAGSDFIKFGYVSRESARDGGRHVILGVQQYKPMEFAQQINLSVENGWGILRRVIDVCMRQKDGKYLVVKDPNKPMMRLYSVPEDAFESGSEEEEKDEEKEEEE